jgi:hypothetical protein
VNQALQSSSMKFRIFLAVCEYVLSVSLVSILCPREMALCVC